MLSFDPASAGKDFKRQIGIVLQSTGVELYLTVAETIELYRGYYPNPRPVDEILDVVGLTEKRDVRVKKLSGGLQRRLDVAIALTGDPRLLFLDEPTTGFDPSARRKAWDMVRNLAALGKTVFLTTHYMDEAQNLAGRVAIIVDGKIVAEGPPSTLAARESTETRVRFRLPDGAPALPKRLAAGAAEVAGGGVELRTANPTRTLHDLTRWALDKKVGLEGLEVLRPTLEDAYLALAGDAERTEGAQE